MKQTPIHLQRNYGGGGDLPQVMNLRFCQKLKSNPKNETPAPY